MIKKIKPYIYLFFLVGFSSGILSQKIILKTVSKDSLENTFLKNFDFQKKHSSLKKLQNEIELISENLKTIGYFNNSIDSILKKDSIYTAYFHLKEKVDKIIISIPKTKINLFNLKKEIKTKELNSFLNSISNHLEKEGKSFSKIKLTNVKINKNILYADLKIEPSKKRKINRVIIKGYSDFPKSYINHFFGIKKNTIFNKQKLKEISEATKSLSFAKEIKSPEILFSKDSTLAYIYLKKKNSNYFDGLINFNSKENGNGFVFNGYLDLNLNNILNTGEQFKLSWKANGEERQHFKVSVKIPYLFNSKLNTYTSFSIYKQDSTFLNTKFNGKLSYNINSKTALNLTYDNKNSENTLTKKTNSLIDNFTSLFIGFELIYRKPNRHLLFNNEIFFRLNPSFGNRKNNQTKTNQFKIDLEMSYLWRIKNSSFIFLRNHSGLLNSKSYIQNELFRIGGINSIRGFNEESIFTPKFSYFNLEYRHLIIDTTYIYSISDFAVTKNVQLEKQKLLSMGLGYLFTVKNSQINISYIINKRNNTNFGVKNSRINLTLKNYF